MVEISDQEYQELQARLKELEAALAENKQAELSIKDSEERLEIIFEKAPDAYYLSDLKGNLVDGNKASERTTGYKKADLIGKSFLSLGLLSIDQVPKAAGLLARNLIGQATGPDEFTLNRQDGSQIMVEISTYPVRIKGQSLVLGIARDITGRKRAEKENQNAEARYKLFFDSSSDILVQLDSSGTIVDLNKNAEVLSGYPRDDLVGKNLTALAGKFTVPSLAAMAANFAKKKMGLQVGPYEVEAIGRAGQRLLFEVNTVSLQDSSGKYTGELGSLHDVTERRRADDKLKDKVKELEKLTKIMEGREDKIIELKNELQTLKQKLAER